MVLPYHFRRSLDVFNTLVDTLHQRGKDYLGFTGQPYTSEYQRFMNRTPKLQDIELEMLYRFTESARRNLDPSSMPLIRRPRATNTLQALTLKRNATLMTPLEQTDREAKWKLFTAYDC